MAGHSLWLNDTGDRLKTQDGRDVEVWNLVCDFADAATWSAWAKHFREHYLKDHLLDALKAGTPYEGSRREFLENTIFPDRNVKPGPSVRSGDFAEILISDLLEFRLGYEIPRTRYENKSSRNESPKGTDIVGYKFANQDGTPSSDDELIACESKAQLTGARPAARLKDAVNDSIKDEYRLATTLNALKHRLIVRGDSAVAARVERFQDPVSNPYTQVSGAAALFSSNVFHPATIEATDCSTHKNKNLRLIVLHADDFMEIADRLYEIAANEA